MGVESGQYTLSKKQTTVSTGETGVTLEDGTEDEPWVEKRATDGRLCRPLAPAGGQVARFLQFVSVSSVVDLFVTAQRM
jgi:hypothetical protein